MHEIQLVPDFEYLWPKTFPYWKISPLAYLQLNRLKINGEKEKKVERENFSSLTKTQIKSSLIAALSIRTIFFLSEYKIE